MGLADCIVDIVETGNTLVANGLEARDVIANVSARVIVNRASLKTAIRSRSKHSCTAGACRRFAKHDDG